MNLEWGRLKAVVLESDDWGLCAWSPDEQAFRALRDTPAFRDPAGRRYGGSTLESAADVRALAATLLEFPGGDGFPPVWQANTVMAAPDYVRLRPPLFEMETLPLVDLPETPSRWARPGMWREVESASAAGLWWVELHGLHHLPEAAWVRSLRRGEADARRAHEQQSPICQSVQASGEYDPSEPAELRKRHLEQAVAKFEALVRRKPTSFCPPDYRWDDSLEAEAERLGITTLQGKGEQMGARFPRLRRLLLRYRWPHVAGNRFYLPPRIAFEPWASDVASHREVVADARRRIREAWSRGRPAVVSTHRANYANIDPARSEAGRAALREFLSLLVEDGAVFLVDQEVRDLQTRGWSARPVGDRGVLLRYYGVPRQAVRFPAPAGVTQVAVREGRKPDEVDVSIVGGEVVARMNVGEYLLEWKSP